MAAAQGLSAAPAAPVVGPGSRADWMWLSRCMARNRSSRVVPEEDGRATRRTRLPCRLGCSSQRIARALRACSTLPSRCVCTSAHFFPLLVLAISIGWVLNYSLAVMPAIGELKGTPCKYESLPFIYKSTAILIYFVLSLLSRVPVVLNTFDGHIRSTWTRGWCNPRSCFINLIVTAPPRVLAAGAVAHFVHITALAGCEECCPRLFWTLKVHAGFSCSVGFLVLLLVCRHEDQYAASLDTPENPPHRDIVARLPGHTYKEPDDSGKGWQPSAGECAICLCEWEPGEAIKVTPCSHCFHEECIAKWVKVRCTCAFCRSDSQRR